MKIAICDDEPYFINTIQREVENYMQENHLPYEIDTFSSGEELLAAGMDILEYHTIFMDINMAQIDGIHTAKRVREISDSVFIVFVTAFIDYSLEGYKVNAIRYLLKDRENMTAAVYECLDTILKEKSIENKKLLFHFQEGNREIMPNKIMYIESRLHKLEFHVKQEKAQIYTLYGTLNEIEQMLEGKGQFLRIHQSYVVNLFYVKRINGYEVIMTDETKLPVPKAKYSLVKDAYISFKGEM